MTGFACARVCEMIVFSFLIETKTWMMSTNGVGVLWIADVEDVMSK